MEVFIFTEGSSEIGLGHITRCLSLAQALLMEGLKPTFYLGGDKVAEEFLRKEGFEAKVFPSLEEIEKLPKGYGAFVDSYLAGEGFYKEISERFEKKVYLDDYFRLDYPEGTILNYIPALEVPPQYRGRKLLWGEKYHLLRKPFWNVGKKPLRKRVKNVMVTFGGDDFRNMTPRVLKILLNLLKDVKIHTVVGGGFKNADPIEEMAKENPRKVVIHRNLTAEGMRELMLKADIAVSAGGQTLFELARVGTPTVAVCIADNQLNNLRGFRKLGFIKNFLMWDDSEFENNLSTEIEKLLPIAERVKLSDLGRRIIDGKGPKRVAGYFLPQRG